MVGKDRTEEKICGTRPDFLPQVIETVRMYEVHENRQVLSHRDVEVMVAEILGALLVEVASSQAGAFHLDTAGATPLLPVMDLTKVVISMLTRR
jgi:hypothetical protein